MLSYSVIVIVIIFIYRAIMQTLQRRWTDRCVCGVTDHLSHEQANYYLHLPWTELGVVNQHCIQSQSSAFAVLKAHSIPNRPKNYLETVKLFL
jgi:hypothetical protein